LEIRIIHNQNIDYQLWDACIERSTEKKIYVYSWFLSVASTDWCAIIYDNYKVVMPLFINRKFGIKYLYKPLLIQQLGIFGDSENVEAIKDVFWNFLQKKIKFADFQVNKSSLPSNLNLEIGEQTNLLLPLNLPFSELFLNYSTGTKRNIKKAEKSYLFFDEKISISELIELKKKVITTKPTSIFWEKLQNLYALADRKLYELKVYGVKNEKDELIAAAAWVIFNKSAYYFTSASNEEGKEKFAMFMIVNNFVKQHANSDLTIDFEGSMLEGIARFYRGFNAIQEPYSRVKYNNLPFFLKFFKK